MSEKLDLDDLLLAIRTGKADAVFVHDTVVAMWKRIESLESRASNAGGAVAEVDWEHLYNEMAAKYASACSEIARLDVLDASLKSKDGSINALEAVAGVMDLFPGADRQSLNVLAELLCKFHPAPASKEPVADERAMVRGVPKSIINTITAYGDARADGKDTGEAIGNAVSAIRAALATAQTPEGWRLVPVEATREMLCAWRDAEGTEEYFNTGKGIGLCYERMLAAAPAKPEGA